SPVFFLDASVTSVRYSLSLHDALPILTTAGWMFFIGIVLFSGSLYFYSTTGIKGLAMITPFGGVTFLIGWVIFGYTITKITQPIDRKSTRLNSSHVSISYAVFCLKKKK